MKNNFIFILLLWFAVINANAQAIDIHGKISATDEVDGIHIINKTVFLMNHTADFHIIFSENLQTCLVMYFSAENKKK